jgi:ABC-type sugar transport system ATPase subunit
MLARLGSNISPDALVRDLTVAQQQVVEIAKSLASQSRIIVMDEPTAALSPREVDGLFRMIRELTAQGLGIIYVSHRLSEIFEIAQRVTVLRDGRHVATQPIEELTRESLIELMVGRQLDQEFPGRAGFTRQTSLTPMPPISPSLSPSAGLCVTNLNRGGEYQGADAPRSPGTADSTSFAPTPLISPSLSPSAGRCVTNLNRGGEYQGADAPRSPGTADPASFTPTPPIFPSPSPSAGLRVTNLNRGSAVRNVSLEVRRGEIVALTGLVGAGRTEVARLIFGADRRDSGTIELDGRPLTIRSPRDAIASGICLLTEDRKRQGLILNHSIQENFGLPNLRKFARLGWLSQRRERAALLAHGAQLRLRMASPRQPASSLSGGNQQKVVLAKWLERHAEVLIFDEPTRGIDVGARYEIYLLMNQLAEQGKAILMISSELPEVLGMADRILVMHEGRVTGELPDARSATQEQIMDLAVR